MRHRQPWVRPVKPSATPGFTIIELLVLVLMLALVLLLLTPAVHGARAQCRKETCAARLGYLAKACAVYMEESEGWFPGSPVTTGQQLWPEGAPELPWDAVDTPGDVVQIWDWAAPIAVKMMTLDPNRAIRWRDQLVEGVFACPSNNFMSEPYPMPTPDFGVQRMVSYDSMRAIMTRGGTAPPGVPPNTNLWLQYFHPQIGGGTSTPTDYEPRLEKVGSPSRKIFLADGSRYTDPNYGTIDHAVDWKASTGGAFSSGPPTDPDVYLRSYLRSALYPAYAAYSYRHPCGSFLGLNAAYFDGHVEWMSEALSRWPDPWWPIGSCIPYVEMNADTKRLTKPYLEGTRYCVRQ